MKSYTYMILVHSDHCINTSLRTCTCVGACVLYYEPIRAKMAVFLRFPCIRLLAHDAGQGDRFAGVRMRPLGSSMLSHA